MTVRVRCHAKLNLYLRVYGKRPDGYHDLISVMQSIDLADTLYLEESDRRGIEIVCSRSEVPTDDTNLVWKASELLAGELGRDVGGLRITIEKDIPMMGGLAGGSADGAGALAGLRNLWTADIEDRALFRLAAKLGSDVPFCLLGGTAIAGGRGEMLEPLPTGIADRAADAGAFLLIVPPAKVDTKSAYDLLDRSREGARRESPNLDEEHLRVREAWQAAMMSGDFPLFFMNDFEGPVLSSRPELAALHSHLRNLAGHALLSGSGSCMFAYLPTVADALRAAGLYEELAGETALVVLPVGNGVVLDE